MKSSNMDAENEAAHAKRHRELYTDLIHQGLLVNTHTHTHTHAHEQTHTNKQTHLSLALLPCIAILVQAYR